MSDKLTVGDPVPWFQAETLANTKHDLCILGGRWLGLCFVNDLQDIHVMKTLTEIIVQLGRSFNDNHFVFYAVLTALPSLGIDPFIQASHRGLGFMKDYDGSITDKYGAKGSPQFVLIDPQMKVHEIFKLGANGSTATDICRYLLALPKVDDYAGVPIVPPVLIIPHVFEPEFCKQLIDLHKAGGVKDTGFMRDEGGESRVIVDHSYKSRTDLMLEDDAELCAKIRDRINRRVIPMMDRFFRYKPTRMERYLVSCYDAETNGHFSRHRDDINKGAEHRRFAASFNLNDDYEGCGTMFAEFGRQIYKAPLGGGIIFSTAILHEVMPITKGRRYAFIPFFYGEQEVELRLKNNANLRGWDKAYTGDGDRLEIG